MSLKNLLYSSIIEFNLRYAGRLWFNSNYKSNKIYIFYIWCKPETSGISQIESKFSTDKKYFHISFFISLTYKLFLNIYRILTDVRLCHIKE